MKRTLIMPPVGKSERDRMEEIKFFLFVSKLTKTARAVGAEDETTILKNLIEITQTNETLITLAANNIVTISCRPQELEVAVTAKYMAYPYRFVEKRLMHSRKFYDLVTEYLKDRTTNTLFPRLQEELTNEIITFNKRMMERVCPIMNFLDAVVVESSEQWNS